MKEKEKRPDQLGEPKQGANIIDLEYYKGNELFCNNNTYLSDIHVQNQLQLNNQLVEIFAYPNSIKKAVKETGLSIDKISKNIDYLCCSCKVIHLSKMRDKTGRLLDYYVSAGYEYDIYEMIIDRIFKSGKSFFQLWRELETGAEALQDQLDYLIDKGVIIQLKKRYYISNNFRRRMLNHEKYYRYGK